MTDRTIIAVVSDLMRSGLTVEQQISVAELAYLKGIEAGRAAERAEHTEYERERKRAYRMSQDVPGQKEKKQKKNNIYINNKPLEGVQGKPLSRDKLGHRTAEPLFVEFWAAFPRKIGKGAARKAYRNALKRATAGEILAGAKRYAGTGPEPQFTAHPTTWLNADRWLDEPDKSKILAYVPRPAPRPYKEILAERLAREGASDHSKPS